MNSLESVKVDDTLLAYHGPLLYEAKVLKRESRGGQTMVFIHYSGWNKKWDEWVGPDRVLVDSEENRALAKRLHEEVKAAKKRNSASAAAAGGAAAGGGGATDSTPGKAGKRGRKPKSEGGDDARSSKKKRIDPAHETEDEEEPAKAISLPLSATLKQQLVDDWEHITAKRRLLQLPRKPSVAEFLNEFLKAQQDAKEYEEVVNGVRLFFNRSVNNQLLYRFERPHCERFKSDSVEPCEVYGAEHLLRMFVKLPSMLLGTSLDADELESLQARLNEVLKFLQKHHATYFTGQYLAADDEYIRQYSESTASAEEH